MKFVHRLAYYMLGFSIGIVFLLFFLSGKHTRCSYFPNQRVLNDLRQKPVVYSDATILKLSNKEVDTVDIRNTLEFGDVDFGKSNVPDDNGKLYIIEGKTTKNEPITLEIVNMSDRILLKDIKK